MIVDVSNFYYTVKKYFNPQARLDYSKFIKRFSGRADIRRSIAYGAEIQGAAGKFRDALNHLGFETKYKEPKIFAPVNGRQNRKADWDVGMAMDIVRFGQDYDLLILGTADGDLAPCVDYIKETGVEVWVVGCGISRDLKEAANYWEELEQCDLLDSPTNIRVQQPL